MVARFPDGMSGIEALIKVRKDNCARSIRLGGDEQRLRPRCSYLERWHSQPIQVTMREAEIDAIRERIAKAIGWTVEDTKSFSLPTLREFLRMHDAALYEELGEIIRLEKHVLVEEAPKRRRRRW